MSKTPERTSPGGFVSALLANGPKYENIQESRSIMVVYEQQLFVWQSSDSSVLTVELGDGDINQLKDYNVLLPTNPPVFEVECLSFNRMGTLLALIGSKGIMIMQVPWMSKVQNRQNPVFCRSWHVAEKFFICSSHVNIVQALWHPGSLNCVHIVVLSSDNYIRLYDATDSQTPLQAIQIGSGDDLLSAKHKISFSASLGDKAVSFDFGPPESVCSDSRSKKINCSDEEELIWPIYILYADGDVYVLRMSLRKTNFSSAKVEGSLAMYPPAEDNYGVDACCLICLHSNPPVLVIAMASGVVYHCLVLENGTNGNGDENNKLPSRWLLPSASSEPEVALYVYGSVELSVSPSEEFSGSYCQPIQLYKDVTSYSKYYCSLLYGIHAVVVPFIQKLEDCGEKGDIESLLADLQHNDTIVEHLLCSRPLASVKAVPVIGVSPAVMDKGLVLICLLASWEFVCLPLLSSFQSEVPPVLAADQDHCETGVDKVSQEKFWQQIKHLLYRSTNTPFLKTHAIASDVTNTQEYLDLLWNSTNRFREEYIDRLCTVHALLKHRVNVLVQHKQQQLLELEKHLKEKENLRNKTQQLAEKYDDAHASQQLLFNRIEKVMKALQQRYPVLSTAEIGMKHDLIAIEEKLKVFEVSIDQLKRKLAQQKKLFREQDHSKDIQGIESKMENMNLGERQLKHVKEILHQEGESIAKLVQTVVSLEKENGL